MRRSPISISAIEAAFALVSHLRTFPETESEEEAIAHLERGPAHLARLNYAAGRELLSVLGSDSFLATDDRPRALRGILGKYARLYRPIWILAAPRGRHWCRRSVDEDTEQCLLDAALFDELPSPEVVDWWDDLASMARGDTALAALDVGRAGEKLSLEHETARLGSQGIAHLVPVWVALEDNTAGYDIRSWRSATDGSLTPLLIEVKAFSGSWARFFLTRHEWETALRYPDRYCFHIWDLQARSLHEMSVPEVAAHVPSNQGRGSWESVEITVPRRSVQ